MEASTLCFQEAIVKEGTRYTNELLQKLHNKQIILNCVCPIFQFFRYLEITLTTIHE